MPGGHCLPAATLGYAHLSQAWSTPGIAPQHRGPPSWPPHPWSAAHGSWETYTACCALLGGPSYPCSLFQALYHSQVGNMGNPLPWSNSLELPSYSYLDTCHLKWSSAKPGRTSVSTQPLVVPWVRSRTILWRTRIRVELYQRWSLTVGQGPGVRGHIQG